MPVVPVAELQGSHPSLRYTRRIGAAPAPVVRYATQLMNPDWSASGLVPVSITAQPDGVTEEVILRTPYTLTERPNQFLSIELTAPANP